MCKDKLKEGRSAKNKFKSTRTLDPMKVCENGAVVTVFLDGMEIEYKAE